MTVSVFGRSKDIAKDLEANFLGSRESIMAAPRSKSELRCFDVGGVGHWGTFGFDVRFQKRESDALVGILTYLSLDEPRSDAHHLSCPYMFLFSPDRPILYTSSPRSIQVFVDY